MKDEDPITLRSFWMALAAVLAFVITIWTPFPPRYLANDDVAIRLGVEGSAVPGEGATGFVLMTHAALGWSLAALHRFVPAVPLWDLAVAATLLAGLAVVHALAWAALGAGWVARLTAVSAMLVATLRLVVDMQFTIAATLAGGASVVLALKELASGAPRAAAIVASGVLLLAAVLVRPMGAAAGAVTVGLFLAPWTAWHARVHGARLPRAAGALATAIALSVGLIYLDGWLYRVDRDWDAYYRYNWMAARLAEWGGELPAGEVDAIRGAAGWSRNDWAMMQRWFGVDPALHGVAPVSQAYGARSAAISWNDWLERMANRIATGGRSTIEHVAFDSALLLIAAGVVAAVYAGWRGRTAAAAGILLFLVLCVAIEAIFKDLPFRLLAPLQACVASALLVIVAAWRRRPSPALAIVGLAVILTVLTHQTRTIFAEAVRDRQHTAQVEREVLELQRLSPSLIVIHADAFPSEHWWRPFVRPPVALRAVSLAGNNQSPLLQHFLTRTGRQPLFRAICDDPSIVVVSDEGRLDLATTYLREHFKRDVKWMEVYAGSFRAWRCVG